MHTTNEILSPNTSANPVPPFVLHTRLWSVVTLLLLVAHCLLWELWLQPTGGHTLALKAVPLIFALPGLLRMRMYTYRWLSLLILLYAAEGALRVMSRNPQEQVLAAIELALSLILFTLCALHIRYRLRSAKRAPVSEPAAEHS